MNPLHTFRLLPVALLLPALAWSGLRIEGVESEVERNVRAYVALASEPCDAEDWRIRRRFRLLEKETRKALEPFGYYDPTISTSLDPRDDCWQATLSIDPGEPVLLRDVDVSITGEAKSDPKFVALLEATPLKSGKVLRHAAYEQLKKNLLTLAADRGYVEASFAHTTLDIWPAELAADVSVKLVGGPRYRIGEFRQSQDFLNPEIVSAYIDIERGEYYDGDEIARAFRDLSDSAYFSTIEVIPDTENAANGEIPIDIRLLPGTRIEYTSGLGVSTDAGARFRAGFRNNRINRRGHRLIADLNVSQLIQGIAAEYRIPLGDPRREWFSFTSALSTEETDTFINDEQRFGIRWTKAMSDAWLRTLALDVTNESFNIGSDVDTTRLIIPAVIFDNKDADSDVFATRGRRLGIEFRGTDESLGSDASFLQTVFRAHWVRSFGKRSRVLARINAGYTSTSDFNRLPPTARFFAGGDESVRGFDFESLGPVDADGNVVGGTRLLVGSLEYERHLKGNFYGAVFVDAGNAFDSSDFDTEVGSGLGIKWRSPVGMVRLYVGVPVSASEKSPRLHLRLGADL